MLHEFPPEILYTILWELSAADISQLALCCRTFHAIIQDDGFWKSIFRHRFPKQYTALQQQQCADDPATNRWRRLYRSKEQLRLSVAQDMDIKDINLPYWKIYNTPESAYGVTAKLHSIRILDLRGTFEGVLPGRYRVQWRMKLSLAARWNEPLDFTVNLANNKAVPIICTTPQGFYNRSDVVTDSWIVVTLPCEIVIEKSWGPTDIHVSHEKGTRLWKAGMEIDWVQLIPAESLDESTMVFHDRFGVAHESRQSVFSPSCSSSSSSVTAIAAVTKSAALAKLSWVVDVIRAIAVLSGFLWNNTSFFVFKKSSNLYYY
ncbi:hypothetical protein VTP01DRAFT_10417 [Rhizomucor pusillus]|uniref:uncharacterized protein n=1 Tax=Rhizomucor pusillus TaxID=4840 RepID=UPI003744A660